MPIMAQSIEAYLSGNSARGRDGPRLKRLRCFGPDDIRFLRRSQIDEGLAPPETTRAGSIARLNALLGLAEALEMSPPDLLKYFDESDRWSCEKNCVPLRLRSVEVFSTAHGGTQGAVGDAAHREWFGARVIGSHSCLGNEKLGQDPPSAAIATCRRYGVGKGILTNANGSRCSGR